VLAVVVVVMVPVVPVMLVMLVVLPGGVVGAVAHVAGRVVGAVLRERGSGERQGCGGRESDEPGCGGAVHFESSYQWVGRSVSALRSGFQSDLGPRTRAAAQPRVKINLSVDSPQGASPENRLMLRRGLRQEPRTASDGDLPWIYGAAIRAASGEETAARATVAAFSTRSTNGHANGARRRELMVAAVRNALADSPSEPLAQLPPDEREAIGLVRILGMKVDEIAKLQQREVREVKALMRNGLTRLAAAYYP
jgi:hypothetical protein